MHPHRQGVRRRADPLHRVDEPDVARGVDPVPVAAYTLQDRLGSLLRRDGALVEARLHLAEPRARRVHAGDLDGAGQGRVHRTRADQRDPDPVPREVEAQHLRDAAQPELARAVGGVPRHPDDPRGRRDVDEMAATPGLDHRRHQLLDHVDRPHQVHVDLAPPGLVLQRLHRSPRRDAGDVHDDVHRAVLVGDLPCQSLYAVMVGEVDRLGHHHLAAREHGSTPQSRRAGRPGGR